MQSEDSKKIGNIKSIGYAHVEDMIENIEIEKKWMWEIFHYHLYKDLNIRHFYSRKWVIYP